MRLAACLLAILMVLPAAAAEPAETEKPTIAAKVLVSPGFAALEPGLGCAGPAPAKLYLTVENDGQRELVLRRIDVIAPAEVKRCPTGAVPALPVAVGAGRKQVVEIPVATDRAVRPGTVPLLVRVGVTAPIGGTEQSDELLAAGTVELRIPGLSDALKLVGVPTLFLLPGVLFLGGFFLLCPPGDSTRFAPNSLGFWIAAISLSLLFSAVLAQAGVRDLDDPITLADVGWLWAGSLAAGLLAGGLTSGYHRYRKKRRDSAEAKRLASITVRDDDEPVTLLRRIAALGARWPLDWVEAHLAEAAPGTGDQGFLLKAGEASWLIPPAVPKRPNGVTEEQWTAARTELEQLPHDRLDSALVDRIEALRPRLELVWKGGARPQSLDSRHVTRRRNGGFFVDLA
jgi:hypothetical protein